MAASSRRPAAPSTPPAPAPPRVQLIGSDKATKYVEIVSEMPSLQNMTYNMWANLLVIKRALPPELIAELQVPPETALTTQIIQQLAIAARYYRRR